MSKIKLIIISLVVFAIFSLSFYCYKLNQDLDKRDAKIELIEKDNNDLKDLISRNNEIFEKYKNQKEQQIKELQSQKLKQENIEKDKSEKLKNINSTDYKSLNDVKLKEVVNEQINNVFEIKK